MLAELAITANLIALIINGVTYGRYRKALKAAHGGAANGTGAAVAGAGAGARTRESPDLPRAGVEAGEIIAWRHWIISDNEYLLMSSTTRDNGVCPIWPPGEPMTGEPGDHDRVGVHAWKTKRAALEWNSTGVIGRAALWGQVVEHEHGYRAEFAKIVSLDYIDVWAITGSKPRQKSDECRVNDQKMLTRLRAIYGVETCALTPL